MKLLNYQKRQAAKKTSVTRYPTPAAREFADIMEDATHSMPRSRRVFSKFIHVRPVSTFSDALGKTLLRPNAILIGAICSFSFTLGAYLLAKNYGYSLSGLESALGFTFGWFFGTLYDLARMLLRRR